MNGVIITYPRESCWPVDTVVLFMVYAADDAFRDLWDYYSAIEDWIKNGRVGVKPQLPSYT